MKKLYLFSALLAAGLFSAQNTITFKGCTELFDENNYIFYSTKTDPEGKKIYETTPVDGDQPCGGLGTCEFKIQYNKTSTRWEFLADSGNGDFVDPYLIYYNDDATNNPTPPIINNIGWKENTVVTNGLCNEDLKFLSVDDNNKDLMLLYPNPVIDYITISGLRNGDSYIIYNSSGQIVQQNKYQSKLDVRALHSGHYIYIVKTTDGKQHQFKFIKK